MGKLKSNINWNAPIMRRYAGNIRLGIVEVYLGNMRAVKIKRQAPYKGVFVTNQVGRA